MQNQPAPPQYQPQPPSSMGHGVKIGIGIAIGVLLTGLLILGACGVACVGLIGGAGAIVDEAERNQKQAAMAALLPETKTFLEKHQDFGKPVRVQSVPDWEQGKRQKVTLENGGNEHTLLFYIKDQQVVTVYEDGSDGRKRVWGDYSIDPESKPKKRK